MNEHLKKDELILIYIYLDEIKKLIKNKKNLFI